MLDRYLRDDKGVSGGCLAVEQAQVVSSYVWVFRQSGFAQVNVFCHGLIAESTIFPSTGLETVYRLAAISAPRIPGIYSSSISIPFPQLLQSTPALYGTWRSPSGLESLRL